MTATATTTQRRITPSTTAPATDTAARVCCACLYFNGGMCGHEAWVDWPERGPEEASCSEYDGPGKASRKVGWRFSKLIRSTSALPPEWSRRGRLHPAPHPCGQALTLSSVDVST